MKKTAIWTAIAAMSAGAGSAQAAEWEINLGGYYNAMVGIASSDVDDSNRAFSGQNPSYDDDAIQVRGDGEIYFRPSITLDNGLKIGADIQIDAEDEDLDFDETFMFVKGSFGEVLIGAQNSAGYKMGFAAPNAAIVAMNSPSNDGPYIPFNPDGPGRKNSGSLSSFIPYSGTTFGGDARFTSLGSTFIENDRDSGFSSNRHPERISYFTPRFAGFQLGVSYAHDDNRDKPAGAGACEGNAGFGSGGACQFFDIGANYMQTFGDFDVGASTRWGTANSNVAGQSSPQVWGAGVNLGFGGVTIGGSFAEQNDSSSNTNDGRAFDLGASYSEGPCTYSFTYFNGENQDDEQNPNFGGTGSDEKLETFTTAIDYKLAEGVRLNAFGAYVDFDERDASNAGAGINGDDVSGFVIGTGIGLSF